MSIAERLILIREYGHLPRNISGGVPEEALREILPFIHHQMRPVGRGADVIEAGEHGVPNVPVPVVRVARRIFAGPLPVVVPDKAVHRPGMCATFFVQQRQQASEHAVERDDRDRLFRLCFRHHLGSIHGEDRLAGTRWPHDEQGSVERMLEHLELFLDTFELFPGRKPHFNLPGDGTCLASGDETRHIEVCGFSCRAISRFRSGRCRRRTT